MNHKSEMPIYINNLITRARATGCARVKDFIVSGKARSTGLIFLAGLFLLTVQVVMGADQVKTLIKQLDHSNNFLRKSAAAKLGVQKDPRAIKPLIKALNDKDQEVREQAADSLGLLRASEAIPNLVGLLESDQSPAVRKRVSMALGSIPGDEVDTVLISCLDHKDKALVMGCARLLGQRRVKKAADYLQKRLANADGDLKFTILDALSAIGFSGDIKKIQKSLSSRDYNVIVSAIRALGTSGKKDAINTLKPFLKNLNPGFRSAAAWSLAKLGDHSVQSISKELLFHPNPRIRKEVADTLGMLKNKKLKKQLAQAFEKEKDPMVKQSIGFAIKRITNQ